MLLFQLLFLMFSLIMIGEPFRVLISRSLSFFRELDVLQACVIDVYLGGLFLYAIALVPLHLFTACAVWGITVLFAFFSFFLHRGLLRKFKFLFQFSQKRRYVYALLNEHKIHVLKGIVVFGMFLFSLWIQLMPLSNFVFGSIHDTSLHALFVELILENGHIPATHQPYLTAAIIYPQGAHVIFAYSCYILQIIPPLAVFYVSPLFSAMTILAAYSLGKKVHSTGNFDVVFAFIMAFISMWPAYITWGSNPFILGFALYLFCLSLLPCLHDSAHSNVKELLVIGVLFGYLASIHLAFFQVIIVSVFLWVLVAVLHKAISIRKFSDFFVVCIFSMLPIAPFLYRFAKYYPYPGHNIGLPSDIVADVTSTPTPHGQPYQSPIISILLNLPQWLSSNFNIYPDLFLRILLICLFFASFFLSSYHLLKKRRLSVVEKIALISVIASILLNLGTYIMPAIAWSRIAFLMYTSTCLLLSVFTIRFYHTILGFFSEVFRNVFTKGGKKLARASSIATLLLLSTLYGPFVSYTVSRESTNLSGLYSIYAITSKSDYELMLWIENNLPGDASILISPYESGSFIPSVSQRKVVFPFCNYLLSSSYRRLVSLIQQKVINETTRELMSNFGITHVFIGSKAVQQWGKTICPENPKWETMLFLGNPNFKLLKNTGTSYLYSISHDANPNIVFRYDFECLNLTQMNWRFDQIGHGSYDISVDCDAHDNRFLKLIAKRSQSSRWIIDYYYADKYYAAWLERKIYLPDVSNVSLSFDLNASCVSPPNTIAVSIFDINCSLGLSFVTPTPELKSIESRSSDTKFVELSELSGTFSFNISQIWMEKFDKILPKTLIMELSARAVNSSALMSIDNITFSVSDS